MTYREIIEGVPTERREVADAYLKGVADGYGVKRSESAESKSQFAFADPERWKTEKKEAEKR